MQEPIVAKRGNMNKRKTKKRQTEFIGGRTAKEENAERNK